MTAPTLPRPSAAGQVCLCGCGRRFKRSRSLPLCHAAWERVEAGIERLPLPSGFADPWLARRNRVLGNRGAVVALLEAEVGR